MWSEKSSGSLKRVIATSWFSQILNKIISINLLILGCVVYSKSLNTENFLIHSIIMLNHVLFTQTTAILQRDHLEVPRCTQHPKAIFFQVIYKSTAVMNSAKSRSKNNCFEERVLLLATCLSTSVFLI